MSKVTAKIAHEFREMLPPTLYFLIILHIIALIRALMRKNAGRVKPSLATFVKWLACQFRSLSR